MVTNLRISVLLLVFSISLYILAGTTLLGRSFAVVLLSLCFTGTAGYYCYASATGSGTTVDTVTFGLITILNGILTLLAFIKLRRS